jgi:hypothetical protein
MKRPIRIGVAVALLAGAYLGSRFVGGTARTPAPATTNLAAPAHLPSADPAAPRLDVRELLEPGAELRPSPRALALAGQHVRLTGYMAQMELPPSVGFVLSPRPIRCDEAGGGRADLPPESVLVLPRPGATAHPPLVAGPLEVAGVLEVGNRVDQDGQVSAFRLQPEVTEEEKP